MCSYVHAIRAHARAHVLSIRFARELQVYVIPHNTSPSRLLSFERKDNYMELRKARLYKSLQKSSSYREYFCHEPCITIPLRYIAFEKIADAKDRRIKKNVIT